MNVDGIEWTAEPWLPYLATAHIAAFDPQQVFEWGSGGSTVWFAERGVPVLYSVESNARWHEVVGQELDRRGLVVPHRLLVPPEPGDVGPDKADPDHYKSGSTELGPCNFKAYCSVIDACAMFDLVLVDGMARASCLKHAARHVRTGGCLVLDNTDRDYYLQRTLPLFEGWERVDFFGHGPLLDYPWRCTVFHNNRKYNHER
jgi:hypothetical protein